MDRTTKSQLAASVASPDQHSYSYPRTSTLTSIPTLPSPNQQQSDSSKYDSFTSGLRGGLVENRIRGGREDFNGSILTGMIVDKAVTLPYVYVYRGNDDFCIVPKQWIEANRHAGPN